MSPLTTYSLGLLVVYILAIIGLTWNARNKEDYQGYIIGNRSLGFFTTTCSMLAGQFNGGGVFLIFTFGLLFGFGLMWFSLGFVIAYIIMAIFARHVYEEGLKHKDINVPDIIHRRIGRLSLRFSSFVIITKALLFGSAQLLIAGSVIAIILGLSKTSGIWLTAIVIASYVSIGGYLTVAKTDVLQWCFMFLTAASVVYFLPFPPSTEIINDISNTPLSFKIGLALFSMTLMLSNADPWQRIQSSQSTRVARLSLITASLIFVLFVFLSMFFVRYFGQSYGSDINFFDLFKQGNIPPIVLAILGVFTLTAVMSTIDTQVQLMTSTLTKNILKIDMVERHDQFIQKSRLATFSGESTEFILKAFSFAYILAPVMMIAMIWGKASDRYKDFICFVGLSLGLIVYIYMFFNGHFSQIINNVIPAAICLLFIFVVLSVRNLKHKIIGQ